VLFVLGYGLSPLIFSSKNDTKFFLQKTLPDATLIDIKSQEISLKKIIQYPEGMEQLDRIHKDLENLKKE
jgi:hypothetical protein